MRLAHLAAALAGLSVTATLYLYGLDRVPVYLGLDEAHFGVHGYALAETGRNLNGDRLPLFVNLADPRGDQPVLPWGNTWYQPVLFYLVAATLYWLPLTEATIRVPMALLGGVLNIALVYAVAWRLSRRHLVAVVAAALLAASPASLILSRQALDYMLPVPFILGWLLCVIMHIDTGRPRWAWAAGLLLGAGCYSYIASWMMMPLYLGTTFLVYALAVKAPLKSAGMTAAAFAAPLLLLAPWLWFHPEMPRNVQQQYSVVDPSNPSLTQMLASGEGVAAAFRKQAAVYWDYFNPSFLFVFGGNSRNVSSGVAGVFPFAVAALLPAGIFALLRRPRREWLTWLLLIGVITAPIPATLKGTPAAIQRATALLPFVALVSALGFALMWDSRRRLLRWSAAALMLAVLAQFAGFYTDYFSGYRVRSARSADSTAFSEVAAALLTAVDRDATPAIYLTTPMHDVSAKWRFYLTKHDRLDLLDRTRYFDGQVLKLDALPGSLAVVPLEEVSTAGVTESGAWELYRSIADLTGNPVVVIFRKVS